MRLGRLRGVNQERTGRQPDELADALNVIGEPEGFSVWGGRTRFSKGGLGKNWGLHHCVWPDKHESLVVVGQWGVRAIEAGVINDITGEGTGLKILGGGLNPVHMTMFDLGRYLILSYHNRNKVWAWDGNIDRPLEEVTVPDTMGFQVVEAWGSRLWGLGDEEHPLLAFYGDRNKLEIKAGQWLSFRDNPLASRLIGMRSVGRDTAFVWGDRGLWQVRYTGQWPLFVEPQLIYPDCDCISNNSIVSIPGIGYAWMGRRAVWMLRGDSIRRIDISYDVSTKAYAERRFDPRESSRLRDELAQIPLGSQHLVNGFWYRERNLAIWSYPTNACIEQHEWQNPRSIAYKPIDNSWWIIGQGWQSVAEVVHNNQRLPVGTDQDGYLYLLDHNLVYDKISEPVQWRAEYEWQGDPAIDAKWLNATLERPFQGAERVTARFWTRYQSSPPLETYFSLREAYDDAAVPGGFDPGGPDDAGLPPGPIASITIPIRLRGPMIKILLTNEYTDANGNKKYYNGPAVPCSTLTLRARMLRQ